MRETIKARLLAQCERVICVGPQEIAPPTKRMAGAIRGKSQWHLAVAENIYLRILAGLQQVAEGEIVYLAEDDMLYPDIHFRLHERVRADTFNYDFNMVHLSWQGFCVIHNRAALALSMAFARQDVMRDAVIRKLDELRTRRFKCYEPTESDGYTTDHASAEIASLDIRHGDNSTWAIPADGVKFFEDETGWEPASELVKKYHIKP